MANNIELPKLTPEQRSAIISDYHRQGGLKGGATMKKRGRAYFEEIGRKGALARWSKKQAEEINQQENESI